MLTQQLPVVISQATESDLAEIKKNITGFRLDDEALEAAQFLAAKYRNELVGFGRIREYADCSELCSLGVIEPERNKGVGSLLTSCLVKKAQKKLFLVCIIPDFFIPHKFTRVETYPAPLADKLFRCKTALAVPEKYVVMKLK